MSRPRPLLGLVIVARRHAPWVVFSAIAMAVVSAATVFAYNLVRPLYDQLLTPVAVQPVEVAPAAGAAGELVALLDGWTATAQGWIAAAVGGGPRALLALVLAVIVLKNLCSFAARYAAARFGLATIRDLRVLLVEALLGQSAEFFHRHSTGLIVSRVVHDVEIVREALAERFGDLIQDALTVVALTVYVLALNTRLAVATLVLTPLLLTPVLYLSRRLRRSSRQAQERMAELTEVLDESVRGIRVVQAFGMEARRAGRFRDRAQSNFRAQLWARAIQAANAPVMEMAGTAAAVALIAYAGVQIAAGRMSIGDFSAFLVGVWGAYNPVKRLNKFNLALQQAVVAADRIFEVVDAPVAVVEAVDAEPFGEPNGDLELDDLWFAYEQDNWVLRGVSLCIPSGRTVALVGSSGEGKTTLAELIPRFADAQRGALRVGGQDLRRVRLAELRAAIGLVTQHTLLFDDTVRANIAAGDPRAPIERVEAAARAAHAHEFICTLPEGYDTVIGESGSRLSGGQRQRLAIARALYRDPPILILDEATSALDPESERLVGLALTNAVRRRTTLLIAHRLSTVRLADRIAVLEGGRIVEEGDHDSLMAAGGSYRRMVESGGGHAPRA